MTTLIKFANNDAKTDTKAERKIKVAPARELWYKLHGACARRVRALCGAPPRARSRG
jgi:hypothetical protein